MTKQLPPQPSLEHLSNQAKEILRAHEKGDASVCVRLKALSRFAKSSDAEILAGKMNLADAQFVLAMEYGFKSWPEMKKHIEDNTGQGPFKKLDDLALLGNRGTQVLLRDILVEDVALAMLNMPAPVHQRFWKNMPRMAQDQIKSFTQAMGKRDPEREAAATQHILDTINTVVGREPEILQGDVTVINEWERELGKGLGEKPAAARSAAELIPVFVELARVARREGLVAMENFADNAVNDELLRLGLRMTIGGTDMQEVNEILEAKKTTMVQAYERRLAMIIAAVDGIGSGLNPSLMEEKCKAFLQ